MSKGIILASLNVVTTFILTASRSGFHIKIYVPSVKLQVWLFEIEQEGNHYNYNYNHNHNHNHNSRDLVCFLFGREERKFPLIFLPKCCLLYIILFWYLLVLVGLFLILVCHL